ncbi:hypothetical protein D3C72_2538460 [compost metagenome]
MIDRADNIDAAGAGQISDAAFWQDGAQPVVDAVVLDHRSIAVGAAVQAFAVTVGGDQVAKQAGDRNALGE